MARTTLLTVKYKTMFLAFVICSFAYGIWFYRVELSESFTESEDFKGELNKRLNMTTYLERVDMFCNVGKIRLSISKCLMRINDDYKRLQLAYDYRPAFEFNTRSQTFDHNLKANCHFCDDGRDIVWHHTFWEIGSLKQATSTQDLHKDVSFRVLNLNVLSFLSTQNLCCARLVLWRLQQFSPVVVDYLAQQYEYFISRKIMEIRVLKHADLCVESMFADHPICANSFIIDNIKSGDLVAFSDLVRFLVLYRYGGIYTGESTCHRKICDIVTLLVPCP